MKSLIMKAALTQIEEASIITSGPDHNQLTIQKWDRTKLDICRDSGKVVDPEIEVITHQSS